MAVKKYNLTREVRSTKYLCHAPFTALNFDQSGAMTACCYNRHFTLGTYPTQSIEQAWSNPKIKTLQKAIRELDLDQGCENCKNQLLAGNYGSTLAKNFDLIKGSVDKAAAQGPRIFEFEISNTCNLECIMCNGHFSSLIRKNREKLPPLKNPYDQEFVRQLVPYWKNLDWAKFLGGEPFLNQIYFKMWADIAKENSKLRVVITTNATIYNAKVEKVLTEVKPFLVLSIDSLKKKTFERIRPNADFDKVMLNVGRFFEYGIRNKRFCEIAVCPMRPNWREIPEIFNWGTQNNVIVNPNTVVNPPELSLHSLKSQELKKVIQFYRKVKLNTWQDYHWPPTPRSLWVSKMNQTKMNGFIGELENALRSR